MPVAVCFRKRKLTVCASNFLHRIAPDLFQILFTVVVLIADEVREKVLIDREFEDNSRDPVLGIFDLSVDDRLERGGKKFNEPFVIQIFDIEFYGATDEFVAGLFTCFLRHGIAHIPHFLRHTDALGDQIFFCHFLLLFLCV